MLLSAIASSVVSPTESFAPSLTTPTPGWSPSVTGSVSVIVVPSSTESGPIDASRPMSLASSFASTSAPVVSRTTMSGVRSSLIGMPMSSCALASYWSAHVALRLDGDDVSEVVGDVERRRDRLDGAVGRLAEAAARAEADAEPDDQVLRAVPDHLVRVGRAPLHRGARLARERVVADER